MPFISLTTRLFVELKYLVGLTTEAPPKLRIMGVFEENPKVTDRR